MRSLEVEHCPTCKQPLDFVDAMNDGSPCECGEWWFTLPSPIKGTSSLDDSGWHFKAKAEAQATPAPETTNKEQ